MVDNGNLIGNDGADTAADLCRLRQQDDVITAGRALLRTRCHWYPIMLELHKFMVAVSRIEVKHDGYLRHSPDAMVWVKGGIVKPRASSLRVVVDHASLPGPLFFWIALGVLWLFLPSLSMMSLSGLTMPMMLLDLGKFGVSYFELLIMFETHVGQRLICEKAVRPHLRPRRPLVHSGFPVCIGHDIQHGCQFLHGLFRFLDHLPGGLSRFQPCQPGAHYAGLLHVGC